MATRTKRKTADVAAALKAAANINPKDVNDKINELQTEMAGTLAGVGLALTKRLEELEQIDVAIDARKDDLKIIHEIEVEADTLESLKKEHEESVKQWDLEETERQAGWDREAAARQAEWEREESEHQYAIKIRDKQDTDAFNAAVSQRKFAEKQRQDEVAAQLNQQIAAVTEREKKMDELEACAASVDAKIETAVTEAVAAAEAAKDKANNFQTTILKKDYEGKLALAEQTVTSQQAQIARMQETIDQLNVDIATIRAENKEIAVGALEAASGKKALEAVQQTTETMSQPTSGKGR